MPGRGSKGKAKKDNMPGMFLRGAAQGQAKPPSPQRPFVVNNDVDRKVASQRGMAAAASPEKKGIFVDI